MSAISFTKIQIHELPLVEKALKASVEALPSSVLPIVSHTLLSGGKRLRPLLMVLCGQIFGSMPQSIYKLSACLEMLHVATLLHDDVLDNALTRRKKPTAHTLYGIPSAILAGDALLAHACALVASYKSFDLIDVYSNAIVQTTHGEIEEIALQGSLEHSAEKYMEIIYGKTACLLSTACEMGAIFARDTVKCAVSKEEQKALALYGKEIGMAFQLIDDALDFAPESQTGKPQAGDIREGKATPPILLYFASLPRDEAKLFAQKFSCVNNEGFSNEGFSEEEAKEIAYSIEAQGFAEQSRELAQSYFVNAKNALSLFPSSHTKEVLISAIDFLAQRNT